MQIVYKNSINITKQLKERKKEKSQDAIVALVSFSLIPLPLFLSLPLSLPFFFSFLTSKRIQFVERTIVLFRDSLLQPMWENWFKRQ